MNNFFLGIKAIENNAVLMFKQLAEYQLFWGFAIGFLVATLVYGFLITDRPGQVPAVLFQDKSKSFEKFYKRKDGKSYTKSFYDFSKKADRVKVSFWLAGTFAFLLILLTLTNF